MLAPQPAYPEVPTQPLILPNEHGEWKATELGLTVSRETLAAWVQVEVARCSASRIYFLSHYCLTEDLHEEDTGNPRATRELFPDWPHVRAVAEAMWPPRDIVIEKSRRMLASWTVMGCVLHDLLFRRNWSVMTLSRVESLVDNGGERNTPQSLHGKIRFMYDGLPPFLKGWRMEFKHLYVGNRSLNNHVQGFSSTQSPGRGGGFKRAVLDEFAWVPNSEQVMAAMDMACPKGKILISTPHGGGNAFARIARQVAKQCYPNRDETKTSSWERYTLHWRQHPRRDEAWYQHQIESQSMTEEAIAQELDVSYKGSLGKRVYPKYVEDLHLDGGSLAKEATQYMPNRPLIICCDFNHDPLIWEVVQIFNTPPFYRVIGEICQRNAIVDDAIREFIVRFGTSSRVQAMLARNEGWGSLYGSKGICQAGESGHLGPVVIYGDATEEKSTVHNRVKTYQEIKAKLKDEGGFRDVQLKVPPANPPIERRHQVVNDALSRNLVLVAVECEQLRKDFEQGVWDGAQKDMNQHTIDDDGSHLTRSHASSALGYFLCRVHKVTATDSARAVVPQDNIGSPTSLGQRFIQGWNSPVRR